MFRWMFFSFAAVSLMLALGALARADNCYGTAANTIKVHKLIPLENLKKISQEESDKAQIRACSEFIKKYSYFSQLDTVELQPLVCNENTCHTVANCTGFIGCLN